MGWGLSRAEYADSPQISAFRERKPKRNTMKKYLKYLLDIPDMHHYAVLLQKGVL